MKVPMVDELVYWAGIVAFIIGFNLLAEVLTFQSLTVGILAVLFMRRYKE